MPDISLSIVSTIPEKIFGFGIVNPGRLPGSPPIISIIYKEASAIPSWYTVPESEKKLSGESKLKRLNNVFESLKLTGKKIIRLREFDDGAIAALERYLLRSEISAAAEIEIDAISASPGLSQKWEKRLSANISQDKILPLLRTFWKTQYPTDLDRIKKLDEWNGFCEGFAKMVEMPDSELELLLDRFNELLKGGPAPGTDIVAFTVPLIKLIDLHRQLIPTQTRCNTMLGIYDEKGMTAASQLLLTGSNSILIGSTYPENQGYSESGHAISEKLCSDPEEKSRIELRDANLKQVRQLCLDSEIGGLKLKQLGIWSEYLTEFHPLKTEYDEDKELKFVSEHCLFDSPTFENSAFRRLLFYKLAYRDSERLRKLYLEKLPTTPEILVRGFAAFCKFNGTQRAAQYLCYYKGSDTDIEKFQFTQGCISIDTTGMSILDYICNRNLYKDAPDSRISAIIQYLGRNRYQYGGGNPNPLVRLIFTGCKDKAGFIEEIKLLILMGFDLNAKFEFHQLDSTEEKGYLGTLAHWFACHKKPELIEWLVPYGLNTEMSDSKGLQADSYQTYSQKEIPIAKKIQEVIRIGSIEEALLSDKSAMENMISGLLELNRVVLAIELAILTGLEHLIKLPENKTLQDKIPKIATLIKKPATGPYIFRSSSDKRLLLDEAILAKDYELIEILMAESEIFHELPSTYKLEGLDLAAYMVSPKKDEKLLEILALTKRGYLDQTTETKIIDKLFYKAIKAGDLLGVKKIVKSYPDFLARQLENDINQNYPIILAVNENQTGIVEYLLSKGEGLSNTRKNKNNKSDIEIFQMQNETFRKSIMSCCLKIGNTETIKIILSHNSDIIISTAPGKNILEIIKEEKCLHHADIFSGLAKIFYESIKSGSLEKVKEILKYYPQLVDSPMHDAEWGNYPIVLAAHNDKLDLVEYLLKQGAKFSLSRKNKVGIADVDILKTKDKNFYEKIIYTALQSESRETVEAILTLDKNILSTAKITADLLDLVLVKNGSCISIPAVKDEVAKIFLESIKNDNLEKVKKILLHYPDLLNTPLQYDDAENYPVVLATQFNKQELVDFLLQQGAKFSPSRKNKLGISDVAVLRGLDKESQKRIFAHALKLSDVDTSRAVLAANSALAYSYSKCMSKDRLFTSSFGKMITGTKPVSLSVGMVK